MTDDPTPHASGPPERRHSTPRSTPPRPASGSGWGFAVGLLVTGLVVGGGAAGCNVLLGSSGEGPGSGTDIADVSRSAEPADPDEIGTVQNFGVPTASHVEVGTAVEYGVHPPVGGDHYVIWQDCGVYDEPIRTELGVHSQEHGAVWITYDEDALEPGEIETLADLYRPGDFVLVSPMENLPAPVVASAWGAQVVVEDPEAPELEEFLREFDRAVTTPEHGGPCSGAYSGTEAEFEEDGDLIEDLVEEHG
ncbi:DUF3105 domain-containing protein [Nocardiopsis coralli]|uniref:DUF3105 domain-containing protein n=1 Tax=Nocardiopsis coralli TaxID=2772213 RepID=UPI002E299F83|nr:DUF3105 domain-containing protein [Nocardiopsis coralli]